MACSGFINTPEPAFVSACASHTRCRTWGIDTYDGDVDAERLNLVMNVEDFAGVVGFHRDVLDMPVESTWDGDEGPGAILRAGNGRTIEVFGPPWGARQDRRPVAGVEVAVEVADVEAWHERLVERGIPIARGLVDNPWGDRSFGIDDPSGVRIWILEETDNT